MMTIPNRRGLVAAMALAGATILAMPAHGQSHAGHGARPAVVEALLRDIAMAEQKLTALGAAIPESAYGWRPAAGVRSVGEVLVHVAADNYFLPTVWGVSAPAATGITNGSYESVQAYEQRSMSKAEANEAVRASFAHVRTALEQADDAFLARQLNVFGMEMTGLDFAILTTTHLHEHLGQMIAYARSNGVVPPWSQ